MENNASYIGESSYIVAHAIALNGPEYPKVYRKLAACSEAAILSASAKREEQLEGYQILDTLQAEAIDDTEMLHTYGRILRFADVATPAELKALRDDLASLDIPSIEETSSEAVPSLKDRFKDVAKKILDKVATEEPELPQSTSSQPALPVLPATYNQGSSELSPTDIELFKAARLARRQMWTSAKVLDFLGLSEINHDESKIWLEKFERRTYWMSAKHLLGYDIGNSELAKRIKNADPEALKAQFPDMEKRMESVDRFMKKREALIKRSREN